MGILGSSEMNYILNDAGDPVQELDILAWARWFQTADRTIARDELPGDVTVSTVFLGIDHNFGGGRPLLFETMVFGGSLDQEQERYTTRQRALAGHARWLDAAKEAQP
jgi:hypothetical protein